MDTGSPATDLPLLALTLHQPIGLAVVTLDWPLPAFRSQGACLLAIHQGAGYDYAAAKKIALQTGHILPSRSQDRIGVVGVGRFDGARLLEVEAIPVVYCKGNPGLWRLSPADERVVRDRYRTAMGARSKRPISGGPLMPWGDT